MKRTRLTKYEYACLFLEQDGRCGCGCGERLEAGNIDEEHSRPVALLGEAKPDSLWRRECHKAKTKGDVKRIAKAKRQGGETGQCARRERNGPRLKSRGFDRTLSKKFSGKVIRKDYHNDRD